MNPDELERTLLDNIPVIYDTYNGISVKSNSWIESFHGNTILFKRVLQKSLHTWRSKGYFGVWLHLPISSAIFIPIAVEVGFWFHHARPKYVVLCVWLPHATKSRLPLAPCHYVSVGGCVINSKNQILCVQEKTGPTAHMQLWKFPGGLCETGENIAHAVRFHYEFFT